MCHAQNRSMFPAKYAELIECIEVTWIGWEALVCVVF